MLACVEAGWGGGMCAEMLSGLRMELRVQIEGGGGEGEG